jgi:hypothetical protein
MPVVYSEYAKGVTDPFQRGVIELWPESVDFFGALPFMSAPGGTYRYLQEGALASNVAFRAINETPAEGSGLLLDLVEQVYPLAGNMDVDRVEILRHGQEARMKRLALRVKEKAVAWANTFVFGNNASNAREPTGLRNRLRSVGGSVDGTNYRSRIFTNSASSGGAALSLAQLDRAIGLVDGANAMLWPKALADRLPAAARDTGVGGFVTQDKNDLGAPILRYNGLQIYTGYGVTPLGEYLPFNEVGSGGGGAVTASIYIMRLSDDGVCGLETAPMEVTDMGLINNGVHYRTNIEHDVGMAILDPFSAIRFSSITNAAIVK